MKIVGIVVESRVIPVQDAIKPGIVDPFASTSTGTFIIKIVEKVMEDNPNHHPNISI